MVRYPPLHGSVPPPGHWLEIELGAHAAGGGFPPWVLSVARWVRNSARGRFFKARRTAEFLRSGGKVFGRGALAWVARGRDFKPRRPDHFAVDILRTVVSCFTTEGHGGEPRIHTDGNVTRCVLRPAWSLYGSFACSLKGGRRQSSRKNMRLLTSPALSSASNNGLVESLDFTIADSAPCNSSCPRRRPERNPGSARFEH